MSLFVTTLAFGGTPLAPIAKSGILAASITSGVIGWAVLRYGGTLRGVPFRRG